jgi:PIN domain nuclease of toxin-antitoxin system
VIVLDTHTLVWWVNGDLTERSTAALAAIESERQSGEIVISSISSWEVAMLVARQRIALSMDLAAWLKGIEAIAGVRFLPVDNEIAVKAVELPGDFHKDPADRIVVATARKLGAAVVTADEKIHAYPHVRTIW